jgi:hypothetical protein
MTRRHNERGSISIWVVTATIVMMTLVGLAVDLGGQVHAQQRAHDVAAQAARVGGGQQVEAGPAVEGRYVECRHRRGPNAPPSSTSRRPGSTGTVTVTGGDHPGPRRASPTSYDAHLPRASSASGI